MPSVSQAQSRLPAIKVRVETINDYQWTTDEWAIMKRGGSVPVVVNGIVVRAKMSRSLRRKQQLQPRRQV